jgi:ornithine cyclodeaminase/alanine dehydrogenase-like protein (mu-crystallin family)
MRVVCRFFFGAFPRLSPILFTASALFIQSLPDVSSSATSLVLFGSGAQAKYHAQVLAATVPTLRKITIVARRETERLQTLVRELQQALDAKQSGYEVRSIVDTPESEQVGAAVANADIICTMTSSTAPLFQSPVKSSCALVLIGSYKPHMREISSQVLAQAREGGRKVVVDSREACLKEAGELIEAGMGGEDVVELGEVLNGASMGGNSGKGAYLFKSVSYAFRPREGVADLRISGRDFDPGYCHRGCHASDGEAEGCRHGHT